ncbi:MAG: hypothetical protein N2596_05265 [Syntrophorhabdaceae bacterium]|nr:hypothetical protein [Syntrophorhabdaceae bacterium]
MTDLDFKEGLFQYNTLKGDFNLIKGEIKDLKEWDDGYLAFSNKEIRIAHVDVSLDSLSGRVNGIIPGIEGYLMEANLWRTKDGIIEEMYIERDGNKFYLEKWILFKTPDTNKGGFKCFYREADTLVNERGIFKRDHISAIEVIVPEARLDIFLTVKRG